MTSKELEFVLNQLKKEIEVTAEVNVLTNDGKLLPIYDGIGNSKEYLLSEFKMAVILKEAYDELDSDGNPYGGGWSLPYDCFMSEEQKWTVRTWQRIIYLVFALRNNLKYNEMDYTRDNLSMGDVLRSIAWINLNKMPGKSSSDNSYIEKFKTYWVDIVRKQLECCLPDVIICCNVFHACKGELFPDVELLEVVPVETKLKDITIYKRGNTLIFDVSHPGIIGEKDENIGKYIDSINELIRKYKKK
jgi:hypothetical protein